MAMPVRSKKLRCRATVKQRGDHYTAGTHPHLHEADPGSLAKAKISVVKKSGREHVFISAGTRSSGGKLSDELPAQTIKLVKVG